MRTPGTTDPGLPTGAVARLFGVSPTTVRSWERRYGIGPADQEPGRHRRWHAGDVAVLETMCRLTSRGLPRARPPGSPWPAPTARTRPRPRTPSRLRTRSRPSSRTGSGRPAAD
ncbi:MerR family transcriptional regulator [Kitasatospora saccharophila]|uniref:MerR family transcriptional regulator n=1 Tax=Kitasatospora saccharophila TaxID=407973 RepID=UPI003645C426